MPTDDQKQIAQIINATISPILGFIKSTASAGNLSLVTISPPSETQTSPGTQMDLVLMNSKTTIPPSIDTLSLLVNLTNSPLNLQSDIKLSLSDPDNRLVVCLIDVVTSKLHATIHYQKSDSDPIPIGPNQMILVALKSELNEGDIAIVDIVASKQRLPVINNPPRYFRKINYLLFAWIFGLSLLLLAIMLYFVFAKNTNAGFRRRRF
jgi:hypothetical protein